MSKSLFSLCALTLLACGCHDTPSSSSVSTAQHAIPVAQPIVSIVPIIDNTKHNYDWSLSDELSSAIYAQVSQKDDLILNHSSQVRAKANPLLETHNPFDADISWMKRAFRNEEFVAFLELVEHEEVLNQNKIKPQDPHTCSSELRIGMRVRVIDLRGQEPKVILQELIHDAHHIPSPFNHLNFYQVSWKDPSFDVSPIGAAHAKFTRALSERLADYILTAVKE